MTRISTASVLALLGCLALQACSPSAASESSPRQAGTEGGEPVRYTVAFPNAVHHEARVTVVFPSLATTPLEMRMSRTSPGRYALHEFAKNVYDVEIEGSDGTPVTAERPDLHQWTVADHGGTVTVRYTLFGDRIDGTYAGIDTEGAMLNIPASMMWARGLEDRPVEIRFEPPQGSGWQAATQLVPTDDPLTFTAPDYAYFLDSPVLLADLDVREWTVESEGTPYTIRFALHHTGTEAEADRYAAMVERVVDQELAIFGELPDFDYGTYTFLAAYLPWAAGDGMEHRNSTVLTRPGTLPSVTIRALGTVAHEFFHAWSIERIRPASLEPFDFEDANVSRELWFGEGFTSYYDDLALVRAGIIDADEFGVRMADLINTVTMSPGRRFFSPIEMSMQAPFVDAAVSVDPQNRANTFISYYTWGAALGLALDLAIRERFPEQSLDDFMRAMWERHGEPFDPYEVADLEAVLAETVGDEAFARDFFDRYVRGVERDPAVEVPDYETLLASAGFVVRQRTDAPDLGLLSLEYEDGGARITTPVLIGTPLYEAGAETGDRIVSVNGVQMAAPGALELALRGLAAGDEVTLELETRGGRRTTSAMLAPNRAVEVVRVEAGGGSVSAEARAFRQAWLGAR